ncbi:hypothetical protein PAXRUDRAFT_157642 [Paxillus rubicundulus Ve08.2h10]|uniref:Uncharacterized protein n=1 Tax=Paxillus rubicundulus Ve08.2h10 TaxID=930991 RepID=A0A0D0DHB4_9AGAM|nr:hypothetical protein PAXRUDRAFT_157642 [Paxillus rubicundulus Ve08.2h10]
MLFSPTHSFQAIAPVHFQPHLAHFQSLLHVSRPTRAFSSLPPHSLVSGHCTCAFSAPFTCFRLLHPACSQSLPLIFGPSHSISAPLTCSGHTHALSVPPACFQPYSLVSKLCLYYVVTTVDFLIMHKVISDNA